METMCDHFGEFIRIRNGKPFKDGLAVKYRCGHQEFKNGAVFAEIACAECTVKLGWIW